MNTTGKFISFVILLIFSLNALAQPDYKGIVNILTRYSYLRSPKIAKMIQDKCGVQLSYDEYFDAHGCLMRSSTFRDLYYYDIIIFPDYIYHLIKEKIDGSDPDLNLVVDKYGDWVKNRYLSQGYPSNVVGFMLSLSGFIFNPDVIEISALDPIDKMFAKAKDNIVILDNSRIGMRNLVDNKRELSADLLPPVFAKLINMVDTYITGGYNKLYNLDNFAFGFQRSGEVISILKRSKNKSLKFFVHPSYSYIIFDLLVKLNNRAETKCVAKVLASKELLDIVQEESFCLSPYGTHGQVNDPVLVP